MAPGNDTYNSSDLVIQSITAHDHWALSSEQIRKQINE